MNPSQPVWGLSFSPAGDALLTRLVQAGLIQHQVPRGATPSAQATLEQQWSQATGFVVVGACGLVTRLIAPLLQHKHTDPAVVVVDPQGRFAIPLLGGHSAGADSLGQSVAAVLEIGRAHV